MLGDGFDASLDVQRGEGIVVFGKQQGAHVLDALGDVLPADSGGEGFVLEFLSDGLCFERCDAVGPDFRAGDDEARQFIDGEEGFGHRGLAQNTGIGRVAEDGGADFFIHAEGAKVRHPHCRMLGGVGVFFVIEVVQESGDDPAVGLVGIDEPGVRAHACGDALHVDAEVGAECPLVHQFSGLIDGHAHAGSVAADFFLDGFRRSIQKLRTMRPAAAIQISVHVTYKPIVYTSQPQLDPM